MKSLRALSLALLTLLAFGELAHGAEKDDFPLGYVTVGKFYFNREQSFDNSLQLSFDAGWAYYNAELSELDMYRGTTDFSPETRQLIVGAMVEKNFFEAYASVSVGLAYSMFSTYMFGWPSSSGAGYVLTYENDEMVRYALAKDVSTATSYISIPIEGKYEFICEKQFGIYFRAALRTNINVSTRTRFDTYSGAPKETKKLVESFFKNDNLFFINANGYMGFRFGSYNASNFRIELGLPLAVTRRLANLHTGIGFGLRFSYSIPMSAFSH
jgi:hypothetical protein